MKQRVLQTAVLTGLSLVLIFGAVFYGVPKEKQDPSLTAGISSLMNLNINEAAELVSGDYMTTSSMDLSLGYTNLGIIQVDENLNIREEASEDGKIIGKMKNDAGCEIKGQVGDWYYIESGDVTGYVNAAYVLTGDAAWAKAKEAATTLATSNASGLRVRMEPNTDSEVIITMIEGQEIEVTNELDGWYEVSVDGDIGYVSADYVTITTGLQTAMTLSEFRYGAGVSDVRVDLCNYALQFVGNPYVWGGTSLTKGADCSGFTMSVMAHYGVYLPHSSRAQANSGTRVSASEAKPGDLFFYGKGKSISHVAIYIGNGQIVHASTRKTGIKISSAYYRNPICVTRVIYD